MEISLQVTVEPFPVPDNIIALVPSTTPNGPPERRVVSLSSLSQSNLEVLCQEFVSNVYKKAGYDAPKTNRVPSIGTRDISARDNR